MLAKLAFAITVVIAIILGYIAFPEIKTVWTFFQKHWANIVLAAIALVSVLYAVDAHQMQAKLFPAQNKPLIDVTPIAVMQVLGGKQTHTAFSVSNCSGFTAYSICLDLKYGDNRSWILEWRKAKTDKDKKDKNGQPADVILDKPYSLPPRVLVKELGPGETAEKDYAGKLLGINGALNLEQDVCKCGEKGLPVFIRVAWQNENRHIFDEIHEYVLICTTAGGGGKAFTMIPKGKASQKY